MAFDQLLAACRSADPEPTAALTLDLARIRSPPGAEAEIAHRLAGELTRAGARVRLDDEFPDSPSVLAELGPGEGPGEGPTLQWHGHLDAIDVPHDPPRREGDRLVGRGTADMKGSLAAMVHAVRLLRAHDLPDRGRVLITLHGLHESGGNEPLHALIRRGIHGDAVITGELGGGRYLPIAGLGLTFWTIVVTRPGMSVHEAVGGPDTIDPVEVGRLLHGELAGLRDDLARRGGDAPRPSLFVGKFVAGDYVNRIPVSAELAGTRRHDTTTTPEQVIDELRQIVERTGARTGADIALDAIAVADSFEVAADERIVTATRAAHRDLTGSDLPTRRVGVATNAVHFVREAGIPAVGYGPDHATNHSDRESIAVSELGRIAGGFALATAHFLGADG